MYSAVQRGVARGPGNCFCEGNARFLSLDNEHAVTFSRPKMAVDVLCNTTSILLRILS